MLKSMYYNSIYNGQQFETFELFTYRTASLHFAYHKKTYVDLFDHTNPHYIIELMLGMLYMYVNETRFIARQQTTSLNMK